MNRLRVAEASSGDAGAGDVVVSEPSHDRLGAFLRQGLVGGFRADVVGMAFHRVIHVGWFARSVAISLRALSEVTAKESSEVLDNPFKRLDGVIQFLMGTGTNGHLIELFAFAGLNKTTGKAKTAAAERGLIRIRMVGNLLDFRAGYHEGLRQKTF